MRRVVRALAPIAIIISLFCIICFRVDASAIALDETSGVVDPEMSVLTKEVVLASIVTIASKVFAIFAIAIAMPIGVGIIREDGEKNALFGALMIAFSGVGLFFGTFCLLALGMVIYWTHKNDWVQTYAAALAIFVLRLTTMLITFGMMIYIFSNTAA